MSPTLRYRPRVAQRVRFPNGACSEPFIVRLGLEAMVAYAKATIEGSWPGKGKWWEHEDLYSARMDCVYDGAFISTLREWTHQVPSLVGPVGPRERPDGCLSMGEMLITFPQMNRVESPWSIMAWGVKDPHRAIALTTLKWATQIEEWSE